MTGIDEAVTTGRSSPSPSSGGDVAAAVGSGSPGAGAVSRGGSAKWDRPPPPHDWRWAANLLGRAMIAVGFLMFGFVAYQLWGTGIETARAQRALERDFEELLATTPAVDPALAVEPAPRLDPDPESGPPAEDGIDAEPADAEPADAEPDVAEPADAEPDVGIASAVDAILPIEAQRLPAFEAGDAIGRIEIPSIGVDDIVVAGVSTSDLKKGPGHFPDTPLPGQLGNAAIAGHRTTFGQPFFDVDKLVPGDEIVVTTLNGTFVYRVTGTEIVPPSAGHVVATTDPTQANLTLTSCHPKWTARNRIVVFSELDVAASSIVGEPVVGYGRDGSAIERPEPDSVPASGDSSELSPDATTAPADAAGTPAAAPQAEVDTGQGEPVLAVATAPAADAFGEGWFDDPTAYPHVLFWGMLLALIGVGAFLLSRRFRRDWVGAAAGILPFVVTLYFFFQNVNRLLPPNL